MSDPAQPPPHTLKQVDRTGKGLWVIPIGKQPPTDTARLVPTTWYRMQPVRSNGSYTGPAKRMPYRVGDEIRLPPLDVHKTTAPWIDPKATVTAVDAKRVAKLTHGDVADMGCPFSPAPVDDEDSLAWLLAKWNEQHPDHPFRDAWAWVVAIER